MKMIIFSMKFNAKKVKTISWLCIDKTLDWTWYLNKKNEHVLIKKILIDAAQKPERFSRTGKVTCNKIRSKDKKKTIENKTKTLNYFLIYTAKNQNGSAYL